VEEPSVSRRIKDSHCLCKGVGSRLMQYNVYIVTQCDDLCELHHVHD